MKRAPLLWILSLAFAAAGCTDSDESQAPRKKITLEPTIKAPVEDPTKKMGTAVRIGKAANEDFQVKYQFADKPEVSTLCPIEIALLTQAPQENVEVAITGMEGIELDGQLTRTFNIKSNEPYLMRFTVVPLRIGVFYVTVTVKIALAADNVQEHAFAIPFIAGDLKALSGKPVEEKMSTAPPNTISQATEQKTPPETK